MGENDVGLVGDQVRRLYQHDGGVASRPAKLHLHVVALDPAQLRKPALEGRDPGARFRVVFRNAQERPDALDPLPRLCAGGEGRQCSRTADER